MELILQTVLTALQDAGVRATERFPQTALDRTASIVCVSVQSGIIERPSFGRYLGLYQSGQEEPVELYGWKHDVTVLLELYVPLGSGWTSLFSAVVQALENLPSGLRVKKVTRGELAPDRETEMFRCPCTLECTAYLVRIGQEDTVYWSDFVVRGDLNNERK